MNNAWVTLYNLLPPPFRSLAASLRGFYLRSWRYGPETDKLVQEILERESWSARKWFTWREERLAFALHRAATKVPYYRERWARRRALGDRVSWECLENWEILEKDTVRQNPYAFIADDCNLKDMFHHHTSGTTGKPLNLWERRETVRAWYAYFEARCRQWNGVSRRDRWAMLGGQLVVPVVQACPPFWVWNAALNQLYMSSYHLAPKFISSYLDALIHYDIKYIYGYSSALYSLAQEGLRLGRKDVALSAAITNAEPLYPFQRDVIQNFFQCRVQETYGMAEEVTAASQCEAGRLHLWPEVGWLEIMRENEIIKDGDSGDFICTGLLNLDMPLIRYRVGDRGALESVDKACGCGRHMPVLACVEGRTDDVLFSLDGRPIGRLDPVFKGDLPLKEAQIIQENFNCVRVLLVPARVFSEKDRRSLIGRIQDRMGPIEVILEEVDQIKREKNGKFRAVISKVKR
ncbi:MAG: phenylacetate--CoA ligase family protein [Nitrospira sp.]|nr:phenylacetate--CoA ligase family protein [Nitrospira sp.]